MSDYDQAGYAEKYAAEDVALMRAAANCSGVGQSALGSLGLPTLAETAAERRRYQITNAIQVLLAAKQIRADATLMVDIRQHISAERERLSAVLADI